MLLNLYKSQQFNGIIAENYLENVKISQILDVEG